MEFVYFTNSLCIKLYCQSLNITTISGYQYDTLRFLIICRTNQFGLPYVRDLLLTLKDGYSAQYYGFINSDVLLSPSIFPILEELLLHHANHKITDEVGFSLYQRSSFHARYYNNP